MRESTSPVSCPAVAIFSDLLVGLRRGEGSYAPDAARESKGASAASGTGYRASSAQIRSRHSICRGFAEKALWALWHP